MTVFTFLKVSFEKLVFLVWNGVKFINHSFMIVLSGIAEGIFPYPEVIKIFSSILF